MMYFYDDWLQYDKQLIIKKYEYQKTNDNYEQILIKQAKLIYEHHKNLTVFVSGGINSQSAALAFHKANLPVKYVFFNLMYNNKKNQLEYLYFKDFIKKYNIDVEIIDKNYDKDSVFELLLEYDFFHNNINIGQLFHLDCLNNYNRDTVPVLCYGDFYYKNHLEKSYGIFADISKDENSILFTKKNISFFYYSPLIFNFFQNKHIHDKELQYSSSYQPKNFAHTFLNFPLRTKQSSFEHLYNTDDLLKLNMLDFGENIHALMTNEEIHKILLKRLLNLYSFTDNFAKKPRKNSFINLYEFKTDIWK